MKIYDIKKKTSKQLLAGVGIICLFLSACSPSLSHAASTPFTFPTSTITLLSQTPITIVRTDYDYITASSFQDLARKSPLIVIGQVTEIGEVINAGRDVNDVTKPSTDYYGIGQIYKFQIEQFLKGQGDLSDNATINILVFEGLIEAPVTSVTQNEIDQERTKEGCNKQCQPMYPGTRYLLFLHLARDYLNESHQYYSLSIHPWMFPLTNPDYIVAEDPWSSVNQYFPGQPLADIIWQIENPDVPYVRPTPTGIMATPIPVPNMPTLANPYPNP